MFEEQNKNGVQYLTIPSFTKTGLVKMGFSTRFCGVGKDKAPLDFKPLCDAIGVDYQDLIISNQVHSTNCAIVTKADCGKGVSRESDLIGVDGLITAEAGVPLCTFYADCVPVFMLDTEQKIIGTIHSGWRGTLSNIAGEAVKIFLERFSSNPQNILIGIGPSIGPESFEVDDELAGQFAEKFGTDVVITGKAKKHVDLWKVITKEVTDLGIPKENITVAQLCTCQHTDRFFSFRMEGEKAGRMIAVMELVE